MSKAKQIALAKTHHGRICLHVLSGWEWCEWDNDDGDDIEAVMKSEELE